MAKLGLQAPEMDPWTRAGLGKCSRNQERSWEAGGEGGWAGHHLPKACGGRPLPAMGTLQGRQGSAFPHLDAAVGSHSAQSLPRSLPEDVPPPRSSWLSAPGNKVALVASGLSTQELQDRLLEVTTPQREPSEGHVHT